jgi:hypothetical protein
MLLEVHLIGNAHAGESPLPNRAPESQFLVRTKRKAAFDQLHRLLNAHLAGNSPQDVDVIGHDDEAVNDDSSSPHWLIEGTRRGDLSCDRFGGVISRRLFLWSQRTFVGTPSRCSGSMAGKVLTSQGLKPSPFSVTYGTTEVVP